MRSRTRTPRLGVVITVALGWAVGALLAVGSARGDNRIRRDPPLLFGAGPHFVRPPVEIDPKLPKGAEAKTKAKSKAKPDSGSGADDAKAATG